MVTHGFWGGRDLAVDGDSVKWVDMEPDGSRPPFCWERARGLHEMLAQQICMILLQATVASPLGDICGVLAAKRQLPQAFPRPLQRMLSIQAGCCTASAGVS